MGSLPCTPLDQRIATALAKIGLALRNQSLQAAGDRGLSATQGQLLALLAGGPARPSELAARLGVKLPTVSDSVKALEAKQLVERTRDPDDARASLLRLTATGRREASRAMEWPDFLASAVGELDAAEQEVFLTGLLKMIRTLQDRGQIPLSRMCLTCVHFRPFAHAGERPHHCALVDARLRAVELRIECPEHEVAGEEQQRSARARFSAR